MKPKTILLVAGLAALSAGCATQSQKSPQSPDLQAQFDRADTNNDCKVSRQEFGYLMVEDAFALFDENKNGVITLKEYVAAGGTPATFAEIDLNGNGEVTLEEAKSSKVAMDHMTAAFYGADVDKDGFVTMGEALAYRKALYETVR